MAAGLGVLRMSIPQETTQAFGNNSENYALRDSVTSRIWGQYLITVQRMISSNTEESSTSKTSISWFASVLRNKPKPKKLIFHFLELRNGQRNSLGFLSGQPRLIYQNGSFSVSISIILYCLPSCIRIEPSDFWLMINSLDGTSSIWNFSVISKSPTKTSFMRLLISNAFPPNS